MYDNTMRSTNTNDDPPEGWSPPQRPISEYADFWGIKPESD